MNQTILDELPDDACHLVAVELDDRALDLDFRHASDLPQVMSLSGMLLRR
jgi:hypothetical protein